MSSIGSHRVRRKGKRREGDRSRFRANVRRGLRVRARNETQKRTQCVARCRVSEVKTDACADAETGVGGAAGAGAGGRVGGAGRGHFSLSEVWERTTSPLPAFVSYGLQAARVHARTCFDALKEISRVTAISTAFANDNKQSLGAKHRPAGRVIGRTRKQMQKAVATTGSRDSLQSAAKSLAEALPRQSSRAFGYFAANALASRPASRPEASDVALCAPSPAFVMALPIAPPAP